MFLQVYLSAYGQFDENSLMCCNSLWIIFELVCVLTFNDDNNLTWYHLIMMWRCTHDMYTLYSMIKKNVFFWCFSISF